MEVLDRMIRDGEERLLRLKTWRTIVAEDPTLASTFADALLTPEANGKIVSQPKGVGPDRPDVTKLINYLKSRGPDEWIRVREMTVATGIDKGIVYMHLTRTLRDRMEEFKQSPKRNFWRLKKDDPARVGGSST